MTCACNLPESGERIYHCVRLDCQMTPGWCKLYWKHAGYREKWDSGRTIDTPADISEVILEPRTAEEMAIALAVCHACECYDRPLGVCQANECGRLKVPCAERVKIPTSQCPRRYW